MKIVKRLLAVIILLIIAVFLVLNFANFSSGYRAGVPIKVSHKGIIFKTWEGELNVGGLANSAEGAIPSTWEFSIADGDDKVRTKLEEAVNYGKRVRLNYNEKFVQFFWKGDTKYFVYDVELLN